MLGVNTLFTVFVIISTEYTTPGNNIHIIMPGGREASYHSVQRDGYQFCVSCIHALLCADLNIINAGTTSNATPDSSKGGYRVRWKLGLT